MKIYYFTADNGDGSSSVCWMLDKDLTNKVLNDDRFCEELFGNEGRAGSITLPDGFDLETTGIRFQDAEWEERLQEMDEMVDEV